MLPIAAAPILIAALLETEVAVVVAGIIGVLVAFISIFLPDVSLVTAISSTDTMRLLLVYALGPIAGVFIVHRADRLNRYLTAGIAVAGVSFLVLAARGVIDAGRTKPGLALVGLPTRAWGGPSGRP